MVSTSYMYIAEGVDEYRDGTPWQPKGRALICSRHFVDNEKSQHPLSPSYNPTIFNPTDLKSSKSSARFKRSERRRRQRDESIRPDAVVSVANLCNVVSFSDQGSPDNAFDVSGLRVQIEAECQTDINPGLKFGSCCAFICLTLNCESATQVQHADVEDSAVDCTPVQETRTVITGNDYRSVVFMGYDSVKSDESDLHELTAVSGEVFHRFLNAIGPTPRRIDEIRKEDKLLLFLLKLKLGISFSAIGKFFSVHRTTAKRSFKQVLAMLGVKTKDWILWPSKNTASETVPLCFQQYYPNCRMIIDCVEVKTEKPVTLTQQSLMYSSYKGSHTAKYLIGITPSGRICFLSKAYGGGSSDAHVTKDCGILEKLEPGDEVMVVKGSSEIKTVCEAKKVVLVTPSSAKSSANQYTEDVSKTNKIVNVRLHAGRVIQRIKIFNILKNKVPTHLIPCLDDIVHVCCVLANFQVPAVKSK